MSGTLGLIEVVLVFACVLGFGLYELRKTRRDARRAADEHATRPPYDSIER